MKSKYKCLIFRRQLVEVKILGKTNIRYKTRKCTYKTITYIYINKVKSNYKLYSNKR